MRLSRDEEKSIEAIRCRAQELAAGEQHEGTGDAEVLAALADGTVSFADIPDGTLECCVDELGVDSVVEALMAASGPAGPAGHLRSQMPMEASVTSQDTVVPMPKALPIASAVAAWWRQHFKGRPMVTRGRTGRPAAHAPSPRKIVFPPDRPKI